MSRQASSRTLHLLPPVAMLLTDTALIIGLITYASAVGISHADNIEALEKSVAGRDDWPSGTQTGDGESVHTV